MSRLLVGFQVLLIFCFFAGLQVEADRWESAVYCLRFLKFEDNIFHPVEHLTGKHALVEFCTNLTEFLNCVQIRGGYDPRNPPSSLYEELPGGEILKQMANTAKVVDQVCPVGGRLHEDFIEHSQCFRSVYTNVSKECKRQAIDVAFHFENLEMRRSRKLTLDEIMFIYRAYGLGCLGESFQRECGDDALDTYKEILRTFDFFKSSSCSDELLQTIRTSFIDSLNIDESRKNLYRDCIM